MQQTNPTTSGVGRVTFGDNSEFNGVKVFSATMVAGRGMLGDVVTEWLEQNRQVQVRDVYVTQSSDEAFHCIAITLFYWEELG